MSGCKWGARSLRFAVDSSQWTVHRRLDDAAGAESFSSLDRIFRLTGVQVSSGKLCHVIKCRIGTRNYYVKRYCPQGKHFRKAFGRNRPHVEWRNLTYFARLGIPVPRIVAHGSQYCLGLLRRGAFITEEVPLAADLQALARTRPDLFKDRAWLSTVMRLLADHVRRLHGDTFTHRDLKWRNILVTMNEKPRVFFLDCPSGRHTSRWFLRHFIIRDLAQFDRCARGVLSRTMRLRFYLWYCGRARLLPEDKRLIAAITGFRPRRHRGFLNRSLNV